MKKNQDLIDSLGKALEKSHSLIARLEGHLQKIEEWDDEWQDAIEANQAALDKFDDYKCKANNH